MPEQPDVSTVDGERKTVTALFADIKGSTELMEDLDPEEARSIVDPALKLMIDAVRRYDGYVVQSTGDGIFALFGAPVAHEDHPQRALYAALRMQDELRRYSARLVAEGGIPIQCRVGANSGEVVVRSISTGAGHTEYTPIGHTSNLASRMQAVAPVGSIATSDATRQWCEGYFAFKSLGPTRLRGVHDPIEVHEVTGLGPLRTRLQRAAGRGLTKFVGREREMEAMRHAAELARQGHGQLVAAMADPGVGKSRLFFEFKATSQSGWMVLEAYSVSYGKASAYLPVIDLLRNYFRIANEDDERTRREKVNGKVLTLDRALEDAIPYLFSLLGIVEGEDPLAQMDGQIKKRRTLESIKRIMLRESLNQPLMVMFEDLHWMDAESQGLLNLLADVIGTAKILLLVNYRPEYHHEWGSKTYYTQLRLDPLAKENAEQMLTTLLGVDPTLAPLRRLIIDRAEGNPFFIEEMVQALVEEGVLARNGIVRLAKSLGEVKVPATVQGVLASRIDRLPPAEKELLQTLAVIGREFSQSLVGRVVRQYPHLASPATQRERDNQDAGEGQSELEAMLAALQLAEFIYEQPALSDIEYTFKHALTQEVAYNSILVERRKQIHELAAQAIEALFVANLSDHYNGLAHHYVRSGNVPKAVDYLHLAAQQAMARSAYAEANAQLTAALELLQSQPENLERDRTEINVRLDLAFCWAMGVSMEESASILQPALQLCEKVGDYASRLRVLQVLGFSYGILLEHQNEARAINEELLLVGEQLHDPVAGDARFWLGYASLYQGSLLAAKEEFDHACRLSADASSARMRPMNWRIQTRFLSSVVSWALGYPELASTGSKEAFAELHAGGPPLDIVVATFYSVVLKLLIGDPSTAYAENEKAVRLSSEYDLRGLVPWCVALRGWALVQLGQVESGLSEILRYKTEIIQTREVFIHWLFVWLAGAYLASSRTSEGLQTINEGLELSQRTGTRMLEAELRRLKGELLLMGDRAAMEEAAQCFRDAIAVARSQSAKSWELRATTSLAGLLTKQDRGDEARGILAEIYGWFTEGFDTADLKDAKALLDDLAR